MLSRLPMLPIVFLLCGLVHSVALGDEPAPAAVEFFEKEVRPLLVEHCSKCHGGEKTKGGLKLISRDQLLKGGDSGTAIVPGKPEQSLLIQAVRYTDSPRMPPKARLADKQIA